MKEKEGVSVFLVKLFIIFTIYIVIGKISLNLALFHPSASPVWLGAGVAITALFFYGYRFWPAVFLGAFIVNFTTEGTVLTSVGIATGNLLESLLGVYFIKKFIPQNNILDRTKNIFVFFVITMLVSVLSATIGVTSLSSTGFANWTQYSYIWITWWIGNFVGILLVFPLIISWFRQNQITETSSLEKILAILSVVIVTGVVFTRLSPIAAENYPLPFLCLLPLIWVAIRGGFKGTTLAIIFMSIITTIGTLNGFGPFGLYSPNESLIFLQLYIANAALIGLTISSLAANHDKIRRR